ncbi:hypothetical protein FNV43_RR18701 [Rhamnella rubrinervis]|uniref:Uncharacterized protein n=1 Tax=Rhamnella rubrinervis TaxID=2594499 RepID=A0A8K0DZH5_9ROSA|nr:hypothetical protein FNV43_RR18701 [Rhamnella rubrinervis]
MRSRKLAEAVGNVGDRRCERSCRKEVAGGVGRCPWELGSCWRAVEDVEVMGSLSLKLWDGSRKLSEVRRKLWVGRRKS